VALDVVEGWIGRVGAVVGFVTLATALGWGVWRGLRRPPGRTTGVAAQVLRLPLQAIFGLLWFGLCFVLWQPIPLTLTAPMRTVALVLGALLYFPGLTLYLWGAKTLGEMYRVSSGLGVQLNVEHRLITHGPFALVRHPLYLGLQVAASGALLLYRTWTFVFVTVNFLGLVVRARREEEALAAEFGEQWRVYAGRVSAWIPRFRRQAG
jgi:protein-S-isoprenylcysteine O-methyltransferase Ste14